MNQLLPGKQLTDSQALVSDNGWFSAGMTGDGNLAVRRLQTKAIIWQSKTPSQGSASLAMQSDGNLVAYTAQGSAYWASGTDGHPGAYALLADDGDLAVIGPGRRRLWHTNSAQDLLSPTIRYQGQSGYSFNETSESWKEMCQSLPCFLALQWPGYSTTIVEDVIDGMPVVIQLWKGWCPKFLGFVGVQAFPGGVGAEVGIYRRMPGRVRPTSLPFLPVPFANIILNALATAADQDLWWPFPELNARLEFSLTNPVTDREFFSAGPETSYWLAKWMDDESYKAYAKDQGATASILSPWYPESLEIPTSPNGFSLDFTVNDKSYTWDNNGVWLHNAIPANLLLMS